MSWWMYRKGWGLINPAPRTLFPRFLFLAIAILFAGTGCGLPTIPFLAAPENPQSQGNNRENRILTFEHNTENDGDDFQGYDLYYKLYTDEQTQLIDDDSNFIDTTPRQPGPSRLLSRGFVRAAAVNEWQPSLERFITISSDRPPHIPTDPTASQIEYRLDVRSFPSDETQFDADIVLSWTQGGEERRGFRRRTTRDPFSSDPTSLESFWDRAAYSAEDDYDLSQMGLDDVPEFEDGAPERLHIVWYVMSYGIDATSLQGYYSEPVRLDTAALVLRDQ